MIRFIQHFITTVYTHFLEKCKYVAKEKNMPEYKKNYQKILIILMKKILIILIKKHSNEESNFELVLVPFFEEVILRDYK